MVRSSPRALVGLLASAAAVSAAPTARDANPGCTAASLGNFDWSIAEFVYNKSIVFSTPAHQIDNGIVQFNLTNPALAYPAVCQAYSTQLSDFFYGNIIYNCTSEGDETTTTFAFNAPAETLDVNQTWTCSDKDPQYPDTFHYQGSVNLTLDCTSDYYKNPNWEIGQIYTSNLTTCKQEGVTVTPYAAEAEA
ncbi:hypothetical protein Sste5346_002260 [Sporothrix stenoceras]|uniref:AA1-like domain-containing protein n=1 Tax=Sporothrix stenoceras TaxID=5173 RepID=A0ABR3ZJZ1_9PEZI